MIARLQSTNTATQMWTHIHCHIISFRTFLTPEVSIHSPPLPGPGDHPEVPGSLLLPGHIHGARLVLNACLHLQPQAGGHLLAFAGLAKNNAQTTQTLLVDILGLRALIVIGQPWSDCADVIISEVDSLISDVDLVVCASKRGSVAKLLCSVSEASEAGVGYSDCLMLVNSLCSVSDG